MSFLQNPKLSHMDKILKSHVSLMNKCSWITGTVAQNDRYARDSGQWRIKINYGITGFLKDRSKSWSLWSEDGRSRGSLPSTFKKPDWTLRNKGKQSSCVTVQGSGPLNDLLNRKIREEQERTTLEKRYSCSGYSIIVNNGTEEIFTSSLWITVYPWRAASWLWPRRDLVFPWWKIEEILWILHTPA
jgi:hypothetical protein